MRNKTIIIFCALLFCTGSRAQSLQEVFDLVKANSISLKKYHAQCEAAKLEARTGINLPNPEVEFNYLWGSPNEVGDRKDFSVKQSFDFATLFGLRRNEARSKAELADLEYQQAQNLVLFSVQQAVINVTHANLCIAELERRFNVASQLEEHYRSLLQKGEANVLDVNRASIAKVEAETELMNMQIERETLIASLLQMAAQSLGCLWTAYPTDYLRGDCSLSVAQHGEVLASQQVRSARSEGLPELSAGYMSEYQKAEKLRGISLGVTIPLWSNRNNVARAKAQRILAEAETEELSLQLANQRNELSAKAKNQKILVDHLRSSLSQLNSTELLRKALNAGEISVTDFLTESTAIYDLTDRLIQAEYDYNITLASLMFIEP